MINNLVDSKRLEIHYENGRLYVVNYNEVIDFTSKKIVFSSTDGNISIVGEKLVISKLLSKEMVISGDINNIILR